MFSGNNWSFLRKAIVLSLVDVIAHKIIGFTFYKLVLQHSTYWQILVTDCVDIS